MHQPAIDAITWAQLTDPLPLRRPDRGAPIIVLTYPRSGSERLGELLAGQHSLACTAGTGILGLCEQAASTWRGAERTGSTLSALGAASVRAMTGTLIAVIKSQQGAGRWCETSTAPPRAARTFLQLYPEAKIVCLHRSCRGFIAAAGSQDEPTAVAGQWLAHTEPLPGLERGHPGRCLRVRQEDLAASPGAAAGVLAFLGLDRRRGGQVTPGTRLSCEPLPDGLPAVPIGAAVLAEVNRLHAELGYPPM